MNNCADSLWNPSFSHVYVEEQILEHPAAVRILSRLPRAKVIPIPHYKDVFCRKNQCFAAQKESPQLILAQKKDHFLYEGSPMCDSFGNKHFFYTSDMMNCIYQCEYCYLQGLYPSAYPVIFVNLEDTLREVGEKLARIPMYVCISYDTDMLAFEGLTGFASEWIRFASRHPKELTLELRTKSANFASIASIPPSLNCILAWSLSPESVAGRFERRAPSLSSRLEAMRDAMEKGWNVRLCVDPMIRDADWKTEYGGLFEKIRSALPIERLFDVSVGVFRVPKDSLKTMRATFPGSALLAYPFVLSERSWSYPDEEKREMEDFMKALFLPVLKDRVY